MLKDIQKVFRIVYYRSALLLFHWRDHTNVSDFLYNLTIELSSICIRMIFPSITELELVIWHKRGIFIQCRVSLNLLQEVKLLINTIINQLTFNYAKKSFDLTNFLDFQNLCDVVLLKIMKLYLPMAMDDIDHQIINF